MLIPQTGYRKDIQGLRAIAVLSVFVFHLNRNWLPGGFTGVDIFFVISGYLISSIILSELDSNRFSFVAFYKSRIKRIVPAYYALLAGVTIAAAFVYLPSDLVDTIKGPMSRAALFCSNRWFADLATVNKVYAYFGVQSNENPFLHTWTLAVEMQFYLLLPLLLFLIRKKWRLAVITSLIIGLFVYSTYRIYTGVPGLMYFSLLARVPEFLIGSLLSIVNIKDTVFLKKYGVLVSIIGLGLIAVSVFYINESSRFPGVLALLPCVGAALLILSPAGPVQSFLSTKPMVYIGELSYSIYLWHWPVMAFFRYCYGNYIFEPVQLLEVVLLVILFSLLSFYCIEKPTRQGGSRRLYAYLISAGASIAVLFFIVQPINKKMVSPVAAAYLMPSLKGIASFGPQQIIKVFGDSAQQDDKKILLIGDSHGQCMQPYFDYIGKQEKFSIRTICTPGFVLIPGLHPYDRFLPEDYDRFMPVAESAVRDSRIVILQIKMDTSRNAYTPGIIHFMKSLRPDQYFIIMSDWPMLDKNPLKRGWVSGDVSSRYERMENNIDEHLLKAVAAQPNCYYLDLSKNAVFQNVPFYHDSLTYCDMGHINLYGSLAYAKETRPQTMKLLNEIFDQMHRKDSLALLRKREAGLN